MKGLEKTLDFLKNVPDPLDLTKPVDQPDADPNHLHPIFAKMLNKLGEKAQEVLGIQIYIREGFRTRARQHYASLLVDQAGFGYAPQIYGKEGQPSLDDTEYPHGAGFAADIGVGGVAYEEEAPYHYQLHRLFHSLFPGMVNPEVIEGDENHYEASTELISKYARDLTQSPYYEAFMTHYMDDFTKSVDDWFSDVYSLANDLPKHIADEQHPDYYYHVTSDANNVRDIANEGLLTFPPSFGSEQQAWPDGGKGQRAYFASSPKFALPFSTPNSALLRVKSGPDIKAEGTGDFYSSKKIEPGRIEFLSSKGWKPMKQPAPPATPLFDHFNLAAALSKAKVQKARSTEDEDLDDLLRQYGIIDEPKDFDFVPPDVAEVAAVQQPQSKPKAPRQSAPRSGGRQAAPLDPELADLPFRDTLERLVGRTGKGFDDHSEDTQQRLMFDALAYRMRHDLHTDNPQLTGSNIRKRGGDFLHQFLDSGAFKTPERWQGIAGMIDSGYPAQKMLQKLMATDGPQAKPAQPAPVAEPVAAPTESPIGSLYDHDLFDNLHLQMHFPEPEVQQPQQQVADQRLDAAVNNPVTSVAQPAPVQAEQPVPTQPPTRAQEISSVVSDPIATAMSADPVLQTVQQTGIVAPATQAQPVFPDPSWSPDRLNQWAAQNPDKINQIPHPQLREEIKVMQRKKQEKENQSRVLAQRQAAREKVEQQYFSSPFPEQIFGNIPPSNKTLQRRGLVTQAPEGGLTTATQSRNATLGEMLQQKQPSTLSRIEEQIRQHEEMTSREQQLRDTHKQRVDAGLPEQESLARQRDNWTSPLPPSATDSAQSGLNRLADAKLRTAQHVGALEDSVGTPWSNIHDEYKRTTELASQDRGFMGGLRQQKPIIRDTVEAFGHYGEALGAVGRGMAAIPMGLKNYANKRRIAGQESRIHESLNPLRDLASEPMKQKWMDDSPLSGGDKFGNQHVGLAKSLEFSEGFYSVNAEVTSVELTDSES